MNNGLINRALLNAIFWILTLFSWCSLSYAAPRILTPVVLDNLDSIDTMSAQLQEIILVDAGSESSGQEQTKPKDGSLIMPGDDSGATGEKKCMTICEKWGEDCVINPRTGTRKCRRTCKQFGEECF